MPTIALVDDDRTILTSLSMMLEDEGFEVATYHDGQQAFDAFSRALPDMAVLDIRMPRMDGMDLLQRLRRVSRMPVILLTSRDDEIDEVLGLRMGADDYVKKPFSQRLLIERIRALLRRCEMPEKGARGAADDGAVIESGDLRMDPLRHAVTWKRRAVSLTVTEFLLLQALAQRPGVVKTRDQLMDVAYDDQVYVGDRTIDSHVKRCARSCGRSIPILRLSRRSTESATGTAWHEGRRADQGGQSDAALDKIVRRFYSQRPDGASGNTSGPGRAISSQIVEAHDGVIRAETIRPTRPTRPRSRWARAVSSACRRDARGAVPRRPA